MCTVCGKQINQRRAGSLTQWIFKTENCNCADPQPRKNISSRPPRNTEVEVDPESIELSVHSNSFPIERYKPLSLLGSGASGEVYLATDRKLNKLVAIKILHKLTPPQLIAFQAEARTTSRLNHSGAIQVLDFGPTETGAPYMVLEYFKNATTLEQIIKENGPLSLEMATNVFSNISATLAHAHGHGIFHRDLKPSNILLSRRESEDVQVKLIDFGVAMVKHENQEPTLFRGNSIVGTPGYMSPEQVLGQPCDARSEIYSMACVFFEALTGSPPFAGESAVEVMSAHINQPAPSLRTAMRTPIPRELDLLVARSLSKNPDERPRSAAEMERKLIAIHSTLQREDVAFESIERVDSHGAKSAVRKLKPALILIPLMILAALACWFKPAPTSNQGPPDSGPQQFAPDPKELKTSESPFLESRTLEIRDRHPLKKSDISLYQAYDRVNISNCSIETPEILESIGAIPTIEYIKLDHCIGLNAEALERLATGLLKTNRKGSARGYWLDFSFSDLDDASLEHLVKLPKLRAIVFEGTRVTNKGFRTLRNMSKIRAIDVSHTAIEDDGIEALEKMPILILLRAQNCPKITKQLEPVLKNRIVVENEEFKFGQNIELFINQLAATKGSTYAQFELGTRYHTGFGIEQDYSEALKWYRKAALNGDASAASNIGSMYAKGEGVAKDGKEAMKWLLLAAKKGNSMAESNIGLLYMQGIGVEKNEREAFEWFQKAAASGNATAQCNLGMIFENGLGQEKDYAKAAEWYSKAAKQKEDNALCGLGSLYANGRGVPKDTKKALTYFRKSALNGFPQGQLLLGSMYYLGNGVDLDLERGIYWIKLAAQQGEPNAQFILASAYHHGKGVAEDRKLALEWCKKAASQGSSDAIKTLQRYESKSR